jgi:O-antigen/teichoic acid export membrane protein
VGKVRAASAPSAPTEEGTRQVLANGLALLLAYALPRGFTVASVVVAARVLGPDLFGVYGAAAAYAVVLSVLATLGMQPLLVREIARAPERAAVLLRAAHVVKSGTNILMIVAVVALAPLGLSSTPDARSAALVLAIGYALGAYAENLGAYYQAVERMARWTQASTLFGVVSAAVGVGLLLTTGSLVAFCWGPAVGWVAAFAWLRADAPEEARTDRSVRSSDVRELLRGLAPFAAAFIGITVYSKMDVLLLARMRGDADVGAYTAAYKFVDIFQALVIVASGAVYPRLSRRALQGGGEWRGARSTEIILLGAVPVGLGLHLLAAPVTDALFGPAYVTSIPTLRTLALVLPLLAISIHSGYVLAAARRMLPVAGLYAMGLVANLTLNLLWIPRGGPQGAAFARLGSETLVAVGFFAVLPRVAPGGRAVLLGASAAAIGGVATLIPDPSGGWIRAGIAGLGWTVLYTVGSALTDAEIRALRRGVVRGESAGGARP